MQGYSVNRREQIDTTQHSAFRHQKQTDLKKKLKWLLYEGESCWKYTMNVTMGLLDEKAF